MPGRRRVERARTDFAGAVKAMADGTVVFSWIAWPDKATHGARMQKTVSGPEMDPANNPMPFDDKRMIFGGSVHVV